ncbi:MAG: hypothetical protein CL670_15150 [Balneola sp.]|nr:hypothetical protein [Balneola sp.]MBE80495.1 hypothetical protein [Balneola sp.]|tara:strand:+ start:618 stop:1784 length:1167 start_codon:yes stop_codon:yes gene_type:complete
MNTTEFYESLNIVPSFREVSNHTHYTPLPDDWYLALADIRNSTDAIRMGKYKEVNMAGASIIAALNNFYGKENLLPYLFGGDGSFIALPNKDIDDIKGILAFCKKAVKDAYDLEMAIGLVSIKELRERGHEISVARLQLSEFIDQTIFWGSGVTFAETLIKEEDRLKDVTPIEADFSGLECRWSQVPSNKDEVAAYIIQAFGENENETVDIYEACFKKIEEIYGTEDDFHPIRESELQMTTNPISLGVEWKLRTQPPTLIKKLKHIGMMIFQLVTGLYLMKFKKKTSATDWGDYKPDLVRHADYKKFGDGLRFVASGTIKQRLELTKFLDNLFQNKKLAYGIHSSFAAMVTCYVKSYQKDHIHFVDGTDGGYAKASQELKNRRAELNK